MVTNLLLKTVKCLFFLHHCHGFIVIILKLLIVIIIMCHCHCNDRTIILIRRLDCHRRYHLIRVVIIAATIVVVVVSIIIVTVVAI